MRAEDDPRVIARRIVVSTLQEAARSHPDPAVRHAASAELHVRAQQPFIVMGRMVAHVGSAIRAIAIPLIAGMKTAAEAAAQAEMEARR